MSRVLTLGLFLLRELFRSPLGAAPPALTLALYWITFYYPVNAGYFAAVGGADLVTVCVVTTLLLASRCNRAASYPLLARLRGRWELLGAIILASMLITVALGIGVGLLAVGLHTVTLTLEAAAAIASRWLAVFALAAVLGLHMSRLVSRRGSHLATVALVGLLATMRDARLVPGEVWAGPLTVARLLTGPLGEVMSGESTLLNGPAASWTLLYAVVLFMGAIFLIRSKDLLWAE
jgi:hypothetical protein